MKYNRVPEKIEFKICIQTQEKPIIVKSIKAFIDDKNYEDFC